MRDKMEAVNAIFGVTLFLVILSIIGAFWYTVFKLAWAAIGALQSLN